MKKKKFGKDRWDCIHLYDEDNKVSALKFKVECLKGTIDYIISVIIKKQGGF